MNKQLKKEMLFVAEQLMDENPPCWGEEFLRPRDFLKVKMAYQRWLLMKLASEYPDVPMVEVVEQVVAPLCH